MAVWEAEESVSQRIQDQVQTRISVFDCVESNYQTFALSYGDYFIQ